MYLNDSGNIAVKGVAIDVGLKCLIRGHRWGDVNGDGLDDFICINLEGNMYVSINRGGNPPKFEPLENGGLIKEGYSWGPQDRVRLGDIDGDGRLDYCAIDDKGDIYCWRNGGVSREVGAHRVRGCGAPAGEGGWPLRGRDPRHDQLRVVAPT